MLHFTKKLLIFVSLCFLSLSPFSFLYAQSDLTIEQIMQGEKFVGTSPSGIFWSPDSKYVYFNWNPDQKVLEDTYRLPIEPPNIKPQIVDDTTYIQLPSRGGDYDNDRKRFLYTRYGDIFIMDLESGEQKQLTYTVDNEYGARFSKDEDWVAYKSGRNVFIYSLKEHVIKQLTNFQKGNPKKEPGKNRQEQWLENDQLSWFEILKERKTKRTLRNERNERRQPESLKTTYLGSKNISQLKLSPDMRYVTCRLAKRAKRKATEVMDFVTESGYASNRNARAKVGSEQTTYELAIFDTQKDTFYIVQTDQIEGIKDKPVFLEGYHKDTIPYEPQYDNPREVIFHGPYYNENSEAIVEVKALDNKDRWIMLLDLETGGLELLDRQHDDAWIGGPGISGWNGSPGTLAWMPDGKSIYFQSEETGYSHLYTMDVNTKKKIQRTSGNFEILEVELSVDKDKFYITANKKSPHEHHFYHLPVRGGELKQVTTQKGNHQVAVSPNGKMLAIRYSYSNQPWELFLMANEPGAEMIQVTKSTTKPFQSYNWRVPELIYFEASDGEKVPARLYKPSKPTSKKGPAVIFVHGAGYLQNVHHWWSSYYREYMFHNFLVDNGYTVLDIDYRASRGYGRDWRTAIYRHMGGRDLDDQVDGAKYLVEQHNIDPERIGIYGGSYGGFITIMALFQYPGTFQCGAALRSVTDWAHYNHAYTSNILNTPEQDSIAFARSSPLYFAENLEDHLLMLHGMVDTNVQFQDVVRLAQRLIELGKDNWELAVFPMEGHGFTEPSSWADEYKRIFQLFEEHL